MKTPRTSPPALAVRLVRVLLGRDERADILGDLEEMHRATARRSGSLRADFQFWCRALSVPLWLFWDAVVTSLSLARQQVRVAIRGLVRRPGFSAVTLVTLALAIGANSAIYSVVSGVLLRGLPYPEPERLVSVAHNAPGVGMHRYPSATGIHEVYVQRSRSFESLALYRSEAVNVSMGEVSQRLAVARVTPSLFSVLRAQPVLGRTFTEDEGRAGAPDVVVIGAGLWEEMFGGDPAILGKRLKMNGVSREIVGVMGDDFLFPSARERAWIPLPIDPADTDFGGFNYRCVGRLDEGVSMDDAARDLQSLLPETFRRFSYLAASFPESSGLSVEVYPYLEQVVGPVRSALWTLMATVGFVLLIACANVANLFLARAEGRRREMAVRSAIGAGRRELALQHLVEAAVLASAGGALGLALAWGGVRALKKVVGPMLPRAESISLNGSVVLFTGALVLLAALVFAGIPILRHRHARPAAVLRDGSGGVVGIRSGQALRGVLVASQVALALVLLVGSVLMAESFGNLRGVDPGFRGDGVLTFRVSLPRADYPEWDQAAAFHQALLERIQGLPGVEAAGVTSALPLTGQWATNPISVEGRAYPADTQPPSVESRAVTPGYFRALGIPLLEGRMLEDDDASGRSGAVLISEKVAAMLFPGGKALGSRVAHSLPDPHDGWSTVVGVVGDTRGTLTAEPVGILYFALRPGPDVRKGWLAQSMSYVVKTSLPPLSLLPAIRRSVVDLDPSVPVAEATTMDQITRDAQAAMAFALTLVAVAALLGLTLATVGLYGVISYLTSQRTRELGVRVALGAGTASVQRLVIGQGMAVATVGLGVGLVAAFLLSRFLQAFLFGVDARDPALFAGVTLLLGVVSLLATWVPALRAARMDPVRALRSD